MQVSFTPVEAATVAGTVCSALTLIITKGGPVVLKVLGMNVGHKKTNGFNLETHDKICIARLGEINLRVAHIEKHEEQAANSVNDIKQQIVSLDEKTDRKHEQTMLVLMDIKRDR